MKLLFVLALNLQFVNLSFSQLCDFRGIDSLFIQIAGDTTNIWDLSLCAYCSARFAISVSPSNDSIFIVQTDTAGQIATCGCIFDQRTSIVGLPPGKYWVIMHRALLKKYGYYQDVIHLVGAIQFELPSGTKKIFRISADTSSISWSAFQSECIPDFVPENISTLPNQFALLPNYPNPFNPSTTIQFQIPTTEYVDIKIFDMLGREVQTLLSKRVSPGLHSIKYDAGPEVSSGIYYYRMMAGSFRRTGRMILLR
jgi:hypothetical protein